MPDGSKSDAVAHGETLPIDSSDMGIDELATISLSGAPARAYSEEDLIGKTLGGEYQIQRIIGRGGMGAVYEASRADGASVALKLVLVEDLLNTESRVRFMREAQAARGISSEHVVKVVDAATDEQLGTPFIAMEMLKGTDLRTAMDHHGPIDPQIVAKIGVQSCRGLHAAHAHDVIHRDIKPANLFLSVDDEEHITVKVCDFGIAKQTSPNPDESAPSLTKTGGLLGTPLYSSPEQIMSPKSVDVRSDVWSLCITLYEAIAAKRLWPKVETHAQLFIWICTKDIRPLTTVAPWVDAELAHVIHRGLRREPDERWTDIDALEQALLPHAGGSAKLTVDMLRGVDNDVRESAISALPPEPIEDESVAIASTLLDTDRSLIRAKTAPRRSPWGGVLALAAIGGGLAVAYNMTAQDAVPPLETAATTAASLTPSAVATTTAQQSQTPASATVADVAPKALEVSVQITPKHARVLVDGQARPLQGDQLLLQGKPGDSFKVTVLALGQRIERLVVLLNDGTANPPSLLVSPQRTQRPPPAPTSVAPPAPKPKSSAGWNLRKDWK